MTIVRTPVDMSLARPARVPGRIPVTALNGRTGRASTTVRLTEWANGLRADIEIEGKTLVPPEVFESPISFRATGLLVFLYSYPVDEPPTLTEVVDNCREGVDAVRTALRALGDAGWIEPLYVKAPIAPELRMRVLKRDGFRCVSCGFEEDLMADHVVPESKGGETTFENLQTMCRSCNSHKGSSLPE